MCCMHEHLLFSCLAQPGVQEYAYGDVRLSRTSTINSTSPQGRLEVYINGQWGTVCSISKDAAESVCHQLGYQVLVASDTVINLG